MHKHHSGCGCTTDHHSWTLDAHLVGDGFDPERALCLWQAEATDLAIRRMESRRETDGLFVRRQKVDTPTHDMFLEHELDIAIELSDATLRKAEEIDPIWDRALRDGGTEASVSDAIEESSRAFSDLFASADVAVTASITAAFAAGERLVAAGLAQGAPSVAEVLSGMREATQYFTNNFFNTQVVPNLQASVLQVIEGGDPLDRTVFDAVRAVLDKRLKSVPYWRVVANAASSRSYHYGLLKAARIQGFRSYIYSAILDERTSQICQELDGRTWRIEQATSIMERAAKATSPEEVKQLMPWVRVQEVQGLTNGELAARGVIVPPVHGNCRSTILPIGGFI